jgi:hypothetical protein
MEDILIPIVSIISVFIGLPGIVFLFVFNYQKKKMEIKKLEYETKKLELEIEKQNNQLKILEKENKKYDEIIDGK